MHKPIICIDFDGVIHSYEKGWQNGKIYGDVVPGFWDWFDRTKDYFDLVVYSSRSKSPELNQAMQTWLGNKAANSGLRYDPMQYLRFAHEKPPAYLTIDDRAICFNGDWNCYELSLEVLRNFKPWLNHLKEA